MKTIELQENVSSLIDFGGKVRETLELMGQVQAVRALSWGSRGFGLGLERLVQKLCRFEKGFLVAKRYRSADPVGSLSKKRIFHSCR